MFKVVKMMVVSVVSVVSVVLAMVVRSGLIGSLSSGLRWIVGGFEVEDRREHAAKV